MYKDSKDCIGPQHGNPVGTMGIYVLKKIVWVSRSTVLKGASSSEGRPKCCE